MLMKLYMHDFVDPKTIKNKICDSLQEVSYEDKINVQWRRIEFDKFVSNSKEVLHSIPKTFRKNDGKDKDLRCKLLDEQVLGVLWNVEAGTVGFKIVIKEKLLTRRAMLSTLVPSSIHLVLVQIFCSEESR